MSPLPIARIRRSIASGAPQQELVPGAEIANPDAPKTIGDKSGQPIDAKPGESLPRHLSSKAATSSAFFSASQRVCKYAPNIYIMANATIHNLILNELKQSVDPTRSFFLKFRGATSSDKSYNGWSHHETPIEAAPLSNLLITNFSPGDYENADLLNMQTGVYTTRSGTRFDESNEVPVLSDDLLALVSKRNFLTEFKTAVENYFGKHSNQYRDYVVHRTLHLANRLKRSPNGMVDVLSAGARHMILAGLGYREGIDAEGNTTVRIATLDISGHVSSNMYVLSNGSSHLLMAPETTDGTVEFASIEDLQTWVMRRIRFGQREEIERAFSLAQRMDSLETTGIDRVLQELADTQTPTASLGKISIDGNPVGNWSDHMVAAAKKRLIDDAETLIVTNSEISETRLLAYFHAVDRLFPILSPITTLGEIGIHVHQAFAARTSTVRVQAEWSLVDDTFNLALQGIQGELGDILSIPLDEPVQFRYEPVDRSWVLVSTGSHAERLSVDDLLGPTESLSTLVEDNGRYETSATPGQPGVFVDSTGKRTAAVKIGDQLYATQFSSELGEFMAETVRGPCDAIARFVSDAWELLPSPITSRYGVWALDPKHPHVARLRVQNWLQKVNGRESVVVTKVNGKTYLSDAPNGNPIGDPLSHAVDGWSTQALAPQLDVDWEHVPGIAEQRRMELLHVEDLDVTHMYPDEQARFMTDGDGQSFVPAPGGWFPIQRTASGVTRLGEDGPIIRFDDLGLWHFDASTQAYSRPVDNIADIAHIHRAFTARGVTVTHSHATGMLAAMRKAGFRGNAESLAQWIKAPRTLPIHVAQGIGGVKDGTLVARASADIIERTNLDNLAALRLSLPDTHMLSAVLEAPVTGDLRVFAVIPPERVKSIRSEQYNMLCTADSNASPMQVLTEYADRYGYRIRHVATSESLNLSDYALIYAHAPEVEVAAPTPPTLIRKGTPLTLQKTRTFELEPAGCGPRPKRQSDCAIWRTVLRNDLPDYGDRQAQALHHEVLIPAETELGQFVTHDLRIYQANTATGDLSVVPFSPTSASVLPLKPLKTIYGHIIYDSVFGKTRSEFMPDLDYNTRVIHLGAIVEGIQDSRIIRGTFFEADASYVVIEPMPGRFYRAIFRFPIDENYLKYVAEQKLVFNWLDHENSFDQVAIRRHQSTWSHIHGNARVPMPAFTASLPQWPTLQDALSSRGYRPAEIFNIVVRYYDYLINDQFRANLIRRITELPTQAITRTPVALPATAISPPGAADVVSALSLNSYYASRAFNIVAQHIRATAIGSANKRFRGAAEAQLQSAPVVMYVQSHFGKTTGYQNYYDLILRTGAGNCDEMALVTTSMINAAKGYAQTWYWPDAHTFTVVGEPPYRTHVSEFAGDEWNNVQVVDLWINWHGPARDYRKTFLATMKQWDELGIQISFSHPLTGPGWYSPMDPEWLKLCQQPFEPGYRPSLATEQTADASQPVSTYQQLPAPLAYDQLEAEQAKLPLLASPEPMHWEDSPLPGTSDLYQAQTSLSDPWSSGGTFEHDEPMDTLPPLEDDALLRQLLGVGEQYQV